MARAPRSLPEMRSMGVVLTVCALWASGAEHAVEDASVRHGSGNASPLAGGEVRGPSPQAEFTDSRPDPVSPADAVDVSRDYLRDSLVSIPSTKLNCTPPRIGDNLNGVAPPIEPYTFVGTLDKLHLF